MASTYVNDLRLNEMATGDQSGSWGTVTNTNLELIAEAFSFGTEGITTNADTHTTTIADGATDPGRSMFLKYTGTLDSACTITIAPNTVSKLWFIENATSGSQNILISQGSGANITIPPGDTKAIYSDGAGSGAAMVDAFASLSVVDLKVQDDLTVTDDVAIGGLATVGGTLAVTGNLSAANATFSSSEPLITGVDTGLDTRIFTIGGNNGNCIIDVDPNGTAGGSLFQVDVDNGEVLKLTSAGAYVTGLLDVSTNAVIDGTLTQTGVATFAATPVFSADVTIEDDLFLDSDSATIHFGEDGEVKLIHAADNGLQLTGSGLNSNFTLAAYHTSDGTTADLKLSKSGSSTIGTNAATANAEALGQIRFAGVDTSGNGRDAVTMSVAQVGTASDAVNGDLTIDVNGDIILDAAGGDTGQVVITGTNTSTAVNNALRFKDADTAVVADQVIGRIEFETADTSNAGVNLQIDGIYGGSGGGSELVIRTGAAGSLENRMFIQDAETVFNEDGGNNDFRVESDDQEHAVFVDAANDAVCIGKTSDGISVIGSSFSNLQSGGHHYFGVTNNESTITNAVAYFNRQAADGEHIQFRQANGQKGTIGTEDGRLYIQSSNAANLCGVGFSRTAVALEPRKNGTWTDNAVDVGSSTYRFDDVFATNGTIQTSDRNEKQDIAALTSAEMLVAKRISVLFKTFRWKDKVAAKGDDARTHSGIVAQDVQAAFEAESLDAGDYSMFISNIWWEHDVDVAAVEADDTVEPAIEAKDAYTRTDPYMLESEAPSGSTKKTRLGIRYPELLSFLAAYNEQRFAAIETRLTALEG